MTIELGVLDGDGIGPEIVPQAVRVLETCAETTGASIEFVELPVGWDAYEEYGSSLPDVTFEGLDECDGWLMGPVFVGEYPDEGGSYANPSGTLRKRFDLYANIRPVRSYDGVQSKYDGVDLVFFRQNTEGFLSDRNLAVGHGEFKPTEDLAMSLRVVTREESRRIASRAFEHADANGYERVTAAHKANVFDLGGGLFLEECEAVARDYPDVTFDDIHTDALAMELVRDPTAYDVIVTTNLFGDVLSDEAAGLVGSLGLAPGLNAGDEYAMAQSTHGAAPDIAGSGIANPTAMILSAKLLLERLAAVENEPPLSRCADLIDAAVVGTLEAGERVTPDVGGEATTDEFTDAVIERLQSLADRDADV